MVPWRAIFVILCGIALWGIVLASANITDSFNAYNVTTKARSSWRHCI